MRKSLPELLDLLSHLGKWLVISCGVALLAGAAAALFLSALDGATNWREAHRWVIWLLPIAGLGVGLVYLWFGQQVDGGNNLIIDEIHDPKQVVPLRMAPLVLGATVVSHLFGASVGREGTAVQMGAALADQLTRLFRLKPDDRRVVLMTGMSAGFAAVFGTPLAGAVFGLEVLTVGRMRSEALLPCLVAALLADQVTLAFGIRHTHYLVPEVVPISLLSLGAVLVAGMAFGLVGAAFAKATHALSAAMKRHISHAPLRPLLGGIVIAFAVWSFDAYRYTGLGIPDIVHAFEAPMDSWDFLCKLAFTAMSIGSGFKGGEVTPLFYIGATLGNVLAPLLHLPLAQLAAIGFVAVFAGAANTPLATTLMAMELFGVEIGPLAAVGCVTAYLFSGHMGIYHAQRRASSKHWTRSSRTQAQRDSR
ncbi:voltage-gated chloride channel family protein [Chitinolyticbacter meiyuanensis]|uniref:voltage-gated chloride channel family protein n=1 Tax=Chitinolyticbacter meiyuanensis TaxID=682798 RepID=UPI0011E5A1B2|nr:voltage-gated chloride channel family protein [Chitinolyticbacter meiyuanensis]